mmetsp:Transcript_20330/g.52479  ORF Transcript_20330/g.52479 Transcript_20330/m.52479 type:complete len:298 (-) Transcript_20330:21-914(-)
MHHRVCNHDPRRWKSERSSRPHPMRLLVLKLARRLEREEAAEAVDEDHNEQATDEQTSEDTRRERDLPLLRLSVVEASAVRCATHLGRELEHEVGWNRLVGGEHGSVAAARGLVHHLDKVDDALVVLRRGAAGVHEDEIALAVGEHTRVLQVRRRLRAAHAVVSRRPRSERALSEHVRHLERRGHAGEHRLEAREFGVASDKVRTHLIVRDGKNHLRRLLRGAHERHRGRTLRPGQPVCRIPHSRGRHVVGDDMAVKERLPRPEVRRHSLQHALLRRCRSHHRRHDEQPSAEHPECC